MTAYVTVAELRSNLGIGSLYDDATVQEVITAATDLINKQLWFNKYPVTGAGIYANNAYLAISSSGSFVTGQSITVAGCGATYNGTYTITATYPWSTGSGAFPYFTFYPFNGLNFPKGYSLVQYAKTHADDPYHLIAPYGSVTGEAFGDSSDYGAVAAVREAAMMLSVDIWQARQTNNAGGISPDFSPSPYRMGASLTTRVSGLLAPYKNPRGMLG